MAFFTTNQTNTKYEVFKNGKLLFHSRFTQIFLNPGLISFVHDDRSECTTIAPSTQIELAAEGLTRIKIDLGACVYEIEAGRQSTAELLFSEIQIAADHKRQDLSGTSSSSVQGRQRFTEAEAASLLAPIQQLSTILTHCIETLTSALRETYAFGPRGGGYYYYGNYGNGDGDNYQEAHEEHEANEEAYANFSEDSVGDLNRESDDGRPSSYLSYLASTATRHHSHHPSKSGGSGEGGGRVLPKSTPPPPKQPLLLDENEFRLSKYANAARELYVGNLSPDTTEAQLRTIFRMFGTITKIRIFRKSGNGDNDSKFGFITYEMEDSVLAALKCRGNIVMEGGNGPSRHLFLGKTHPSNPRSGAEELLLLQGK